MTGGYYVSGDDLVCKNCRELLGQLEGVHDIYLKVIKQSIEKVPPFNFHDVNDCRVHLYTFLCLKFEIYTYIVHNFNLN